MPLVAIILVPRSIYAQHLSLYYNILPTVGLLPCPFLLQTIQSQDLEKPRSNLVTCHFLEKNSKAPNCLPDK